MRLGGKLPSISSCACAGRKGSRGCRSLFIEPFVEIYQIEPLGRPGQRRVEPPQHVARHRFVAEQAAVHEDGLPLAALRLVAGDGIGKLHLHGIEMRVLADLLETLDLALHVQIVLLDLVEQTRALVARERGRLRRERVEQDLARKIRVVVVAEREQRIGEKEFVGHSLSRSVK